MPRRSSKRTLSVYANGEPVGRWSVDARGNHTFEYSGAWVASPYARPISLSMPILPGNHPHRGDIVLNYFENLLPDNVQILRRIQARFGTGTTNAFELLRENGRDCVGAVQIAPDGEPLPSVRRISGTAVDDGQIAGILKSNSGDPSLVGNRDFAEFRISIAGAQEKTAFLFHDGRWQIPAGATPSTHIVKLPRGTVSIYNVDLSESPENEWLCGQLLSAFGLPVAESYVTSFEDQRALVVKRFDRRYSDDANWIMRLPVEDLCQASGISPALKYETDGGPGIDHIMNILRGSSDSGDRERFLRAQIVLWMLAAIDGHAKNFSIFLNPGGAFHLAPLYDVVSAWPVTGNGPNMIPVQKLHMAMAVAGNNRHYRWDQIRLRHWIATGERNGVPAERVQSIVERLADETESAIQTVTTVLPPEFPEVAAQKIFEGLRRSASRLGYWSDSVGDSE